MGKHCIEFSTFQEAQEVVERLGFSFTPLKGPKMAQSPKPARELDCATMIINSLTELTNDIIPSVVASAISSLGDIGNPASLELFLEKIGEDNEAVRVSAMDAILKYEGPVLDRLTSALKDQNWVKRNSAVLCIARLSEREDIDLRQAVLPLVETLQDKNPIIKSSAAEALGKIYKAMMKAGR
jgi:HEAT repeat protein